MSIFCLERVLIAVADVEQARENWRSAGFSLAGTSADAAARFAAGSVTIELRAAHSSVEPLAAREPGMVGWVWGVADSSSAEIAGQPNLSELLPGVHIATAAAPADPIARHRIVSAMFQPNPNGAEYLEHLVVMVPQLDDAIAAFERVGVPCKRVREAGPGMRQAFFKLEDSVFELVGPSPGAARCWGIAFMCADVASAVALARRNGLPATEPKPAVQGGRIARLVNPLDGVAVAFMDKR